ncbi:MAG: hypothetical protein ACHP65_10220, partial [Legionellales bacterium]
NKTRAEELSAQLLKITDELSTSKTLHTPLMAENFSFKQTGVIYPNVTCTYQIMASPDEASNDYNVGGRYEKIPAEIAIKHLEAELQAFQRYYTSGRYDFSPVMFVYLDACYQDDKIIFAPEQTGGRPFPSTTIQQIKDALELVKSTENHNVNNIEKETTVRCNP